MQFCVKFCRPMGTPVLKSVVKMNPLKMQIKEEKELQLRDVHLAVSLLLAFIDRKSILQENERANLAEN